MSIFEFLLGALAGLFGQFLHAHFGGSQVLAASGLGVLHDAVRFLIGAVDDLTTLGRKNFGLLDLFRNIQAHIFDDGLDGVRIYTCFSGESTASPTFKEFFNFVKIIFNLCHDGYSFLNLFMMSSLTGSGTKSEMSPPS